VIIYRLNYDPIALARIRISRNPHCRRVFDSQKTEKLVCGISLQNQHGTRELYQGPLKLTATFHFRIKKSNKKVKPGDPHFYKPDLDNVIKFLCDIANGILFHDDSRVSEIIANKVWTDGDGYTTFTIEEIK